MYTRARTHHMHPAVVVVVAVLATYGCSLHHVRLQAAKLLFDQIDEDRSGEIAFSELARHLKYWESSLPTPPATPPPPPATPPHLLPPDCCAASTPEDAPFLGGPSNASDPSFLGAAGGG